ncbi:3-mercaptopyruvate sulfurtransferase [Nannochloropsis oceanica]
MLYRQDATVMTHLLLRRALPSTSRSSSRSGLLTSPIASTVLKCLTMTSVMWYSAASASPSPPPLFQSPLVTVEQVRASLAASSGSGSGSGNARDRSIKFLDSSWHLDKTRDAKKEFLEEHLPGAQFFDIDAISDKSSPFPHMIPTATAFAEAASALGLENKDHIVVYTTQKCFSAARCWWTFRAFGHENVFVLQGGLPAWKAAGGKVEKGAAQVRSSRPPQGLVQQGGNAYLLGKEGFQAKMKPELVYSWQQVLTLVESAKDEKDRIVDARGAPRFNAEVDEPRPGLARGHIPGSVNVPFDKVMVEGDWTRFKPKEEIFEAFRAGGLDLMALPKERKVITTCGSGVTAAALSFAMVLAGREVEAVPVFDASWAGWGQLKGVPIEPPPVDRS